MTNERTYVITIPIGGGSKYATVWRSVPGFVSKRAVNNGILKKTPLTRSHAGRLLPLLACTPSSGAVLHCSQLHLTLLLLLLNSQPGILDHCLGNRITPYTDVSKPQIRDGSELKRFLFSLRISVENLMHHPPCS